MAKKKILCYSKNAKFNKIAVRRASSAKKFQFYEKKVIKNLHMSKNCCTFASSNKKKGISLNRNYIDFTFEKHYKGSKKNSY